MRSYRFVDDSSLPEDFSYKLEKVELQQEGSNPLRLRSSGDHIAQGGESKDPRYLGELEKAVFDCLQNIQKRAVSGERIDIRCQLGKIGITNVNDDEIDKEWKLDEIAAKLVPWKNGPLQWHTRFENCTNFNLSEELTPHLEKPTHGYYARHDMNFLTPSKRKVRAKVWISSEPKSGVSPVNNVLRELKFNDEDTEKRCCGWLCLSAVRRLKADILFPDYDIDLRFTIRANNLCAEEGSADKEEDQQLYEYLSGLKILSQGEEKDTLLLPENLPPGFDMRYRSFFPSRYILKKKDFTYMFSHKRVFRLDGQDIEGGGKQEVDIRFQCDKWDDVLRAGTVEPKQVAKQLSKFWGEVKEAHETITGHDNQGVLLCMASDVNKDLLKVLYEEVSVLAKYSVDIQEDTINQLQDICSKINSVLQEFEKRLMATEEEQKVMGDHIRRAGEDVKKGSNLLHTLENEHEALQEEHTKTKHQLDHLEDEHGRTLEEVTRLQENQISAEDKIHKLEEKQTGASVEVLSVKTQQEVVEKKQSSLETEVEIVKKDLTGLEEKVQSLDDKIKETNYSATSSGFFQAPTRNEFFSGRESELHILQEAFGISENSTACNKVFGISGLGGCGKTTLAAEYSWRCRSFYAGGVFWISAESETLFTELAFMRNTFNSDFEQCLRATLASLSCVPLPFLLVVDNADELELSDNVRKLLSGHWMRQSTAHILVTTRRKAEELLEVANVKAGDFVTLECLTHEEAISFMHKRTNMSQAASDEHSRLETEDLDAVAELVDELGGLPLALAGSHIKALRCTYPQYLGKFKKQKMKLIQQRKARASSEEISKERLAVHTTWLMNFEYASKLARESGLEELTSVVIDVSAYLSPDDIPCDFINQAYSMGPCQGEKLTKVDAVVVGSIIDILTKFSLFQSKSRECLCVHRLVQQVIQSRCPEEKRGDVMLCGVRMLNFAFRNTKSPTDVLTENSGQTKNENACMQKSSSLVTWARLASNAVILKSHLKDYVSSHPHTGSRLLYTEETAKVVGETAVYLSMSYQQTQAFESQKLMLEILTGLDAQETNIKNLGFLENRVTIPLTDNQRRVLRLCSKNREQFETSIHHKQNEECEHVAVDQLRLQGNEAYTSGDYEGAISKYTEAIELSSTYTRRPSDVTVLYCNRSQCYLKLKNPTDALRDADECVKRDPCSFKGFFRRALAMRLLFEEGKEEYKLAFIASVAMATDLSPKMMDEAQRNFGPAFCGASVRVVSSQDQWEEVITEIGGGLINLPSQQSRIIIHKSGEYELNESSRIALGFTHNIIIGYDNVVMKDAKAVMHPRTTHHFENILFEQANIVASESFVSCMRCIFQKGKADNLSKCPYEPCPGCLVCHSKCFSGDGDVSGGVANLQAQAGSRFFIIQCTLRESAGGVLATNNGSFVLVRDCKMHDHSLVSVEARDGASLVAEGNEIFRSKFAQGVCLGPKAGSSRIANNRIYGNTSFGIMVTDSNEVVIEDNEIYQNGEHGIMIFNESSMVARRNKLFENWFWGINVADGCSAKVSENTIRNNKCGGIRVAPTTAKVVLVRNEVRDHNGPGILAGKAACGGRKLRGLDKLPQRPPLMIRNIEMRNKEGQQHPKEKLSSLGSRCAFCYKTQSDGVKLQCGQCYKATYCNKYCQTQHWKKHKPLCKALKDNFSEIIDVPPSGSFDMSSGGLRKFHPDLKGIQKGRKPDRCSTKRFIIKIQIPEDIAYKPDSVLTLYDRSTDVYVQFNSEIVYHIIVQCGVLGHTKSTGKKIFCYASFEEKGKKLRIYLDELATFPGMVRNLKSDLSNLYERLSR